MTSAEDVSAVYKNIEQLTFDDYIKDMMVHFGASSLAIDKMWQVPKDGRYSITGQPNPLRKPLAQFSEGFHKQQLHPGGRLETLQNTFLGNIHTSLTWKNMSDKVVLSSTNDERTVSVLEWTREVLMDAATRSFFGDALLKIEPKLFESFFAFDDNSWKLTYKIPRPWSNDMYAAKQKGQDALATYFALPKEQRQGEAWVIRTLEAEMRGVGIESPDIAAFLMMIYWV